jgi:hypothetical protein
MSAEHTSRFIVPFLHWLNPNISPETVTSIHFIVGSAHTWASTPFWQCFCFVLRFA